MENKFFTRLFLAVSLFAGLSQVGYAQDMYHGNSNWDELSDYNPIVIENFQDWDYTDSLGYGLKQEASTESCATTARDDIDYYSGSYRVLRPINPAQGVTGNFAFYLDFCLISPNCDTQSGTLYTENPDNMGNGDNQGASWANVSVGSINIYDNYQDIRDTSIYPGVGGDGAGSITTSKISKLERVQYTASSFGKEKRVYAGNWFRPRRRLYSMGYREVYCRQ